MIITIFIADLNEEKIDQPNKTIYHIVIVVNYVQVKIALLLEMQGVIEKRFVG